ncbi:MAG: GntR family transcriptional regulator [Ancalomicrobiaceae bacterium]|nr:GntR family transcriptional regulator [Ancalomicrobiaceae bacterium]
MTRPRGRPRFSDSAEADPAVFRQLRAGFDAGAAEVRPLWVRLRNVIDSGIETGLVGANARLPSEQSLCELFGLSRTVVRAALEALAAEGRIVKLPRKGIFVAPARVRESVDFMATNIGVFGDLTAKGHVVSTRTFEFVRARPSEAERRALRLPAEGDVVRIGRVYLSDGQPLTLTHISLPGHRVPGFEFVDIENRSVFQALRQRYGLAVQRADRWMSARLPTREESDLSGLSEATPVIAIESIAYDSQGNPLEYYQGLYNSAFARIHLSVGADVAHASVEM